MGRPTLVAPIPSIVTPAHDVASVAGDAPSGTEVRATPDRARIDATQIPHPAGGGPPKGTRLPAGVLRLADHNRTVGGNSIRLAFDAAQRAEVLHPAGRGPPERVARIGGVRGRPDHNGAVAGDTKGLGFGSPQGAEVFHTA